MRSAGWRWVAGAAECGVVIGEGTVQAAAKRRRRKSIMGAAECVCVSLSQFTRFLETAVLHNVAILFLLGDSRSIPIPEIE